MLTREWTHSSASQMKTFQRCPRKWWFEKICDDPDFVQELTDTESVWVPSSDGGLIQLRPEDYKP